MAAPDQALLDRIKAREDELEGLLAELTSHWGSEDPIYRFYHRSFKVYSLQASTSRIVSTLRDLATDGELNLFFEQIVDAGTGREFTPEVNTRWTEETRPIVEAFFHARFMLEMVCKYGRELEQAPTLLPSGWAAVLELYGLR
ncbi:MAG: hypothetical protein JRJ58_14585 [Deltaproteobacteria bacterium]|nr:hypothetical protein [Deltaproteobacteria bacterium]